MIGQPAKAELNFVPFIDVMLVLLAIFIVVAKTAPSESNILVNLPTSAQKVVSKNTHEKTDAIVVTQDSSGLYLTYSKQSIIDKKIENPANLAAVVSKIKQSNPETQVFIRADTDLRYGDVTATANYLSSAGVKSVRLVMQDTQK